MDVYWQQQAIYGGPKRTEHQSAHKKTEQHWKKKKTEEFWHGVLLVVRFAPAADVLLLYQVYWTCGV